ncbi:uncharacterized protein TM35_000461530 [Trypanosoma theileri]|uniref:SET domain-containing protein n=1 Tax=Trypanosoma theileri TaxID=67003 RepID=A0A1X0NHU4_9TRYP|nr:uncharacterized protein TM35_000461530 [Trypanosoma theileri]ORC84334.1 hypothetical protein TM35_000461530 [Trypanosoma theileri]
MHSCRLVLSLGAWVSGLGVRSDAVSQELRRHPASKGNGVRTQVRCVVAKRDICRGERLCVVPESHILHGEHAAQLLQRTSAQCSLASYTELQRCLSSIPGDPSLLSTRDPLLITLAVYTLKYGGISHPLVEWAACLPPRVPPTGMLLLQEQVGTVPFEPLQRRLRIGEHTAALPETGANDPTVSTELMLQAAEQYGIENVGKPQTEVVASQALMTAFHRGVRHPLTQRQHEAANAPRRHVVSLAAQQLLHFEESLQSNVLLSLRTCVSPGCCKDEESEVAVRIMEQLRWSHFMVRSRAVNLQPQRRQRPQVALVPFLDMLNHSARDANVSYQYQPGTGVVIVASRSIKGSEELTLNYGDYKQRGCIFSHTAASGVGVGEEDGETTMRRIESRQMREWDNTTDEDTDSDNNLDRVEEAPFGHGLQKFSHTFSEGHLTEKKVKKSEKEMEMEEEAQLEAAWVWRFGFPRSKDEKSYIASRLWSKGLRRRIAQLTDVRRKGRPGEFVIGVPEGLQHLREQRERLERERFAGSTVFPPQNV